MKAALLTALLLAPRAAGACAVCFGGADTAKGFFDGLGWAIVILLAVVLSLVGAIGYAFYSVERERARDVRLLRHDRRRLHRERRVRNPQSVRGEGRGRDHEPYQEAAAPDRERQA